MDLKETDILGADVSRHWYYMAKAKAMSRLLDGTAPSAILDVGAGSGFFSRYLLAHTTAREAWCVDTSYGAESDIDEAGKAVHYRRSVGQLDADLVLLMDVLEHVDDDIELLWQYAAKVPRGSKFLITVPAFQFLWSGHDEFLGHKRRYTLQRLEATIRRAGLAVAFGAYYFGIVFPIAACLRLAQRARGARQTARSQLTTHSPAVNATLKFVCDVELPLMSFNRLAGLSIFCTAEKI